MKVLSKAQMKFVRNLHIKKNRDEYHLFIAEGKKCVSDLLPYFQLYLAAVCPSEDIHIPSCYVCDEQQMAQMSLLDTPTSVLAVFYQSQDCQDIPTTGIRLALDGVQNPGNLGTIIRTADWFGVRNILCSRDTADCYNPKVVQATMGALSRVRLHYVDNLAQTLQQLHMIHQSPIYGTLLNGANIYTQSNLSTKQSPIIVMGNEGQGISEKVQTVITQSIRIPSYPEGCPTSESLNVAIATAIILAYLRQQ